MVKSSIILFLTWLTELSMLMLFFWLVTSYGSVDRCQHTLPAFRAEGGDSMFLQDVGIYLQGRMTSQSRRITLDILLQ
jgi:hypothetical protein